MNFSSLSMFSELSCSFNESFENIREAVNFDENKLELYKTDRDELLVKPQAGSKDDWELKVFRNKKFIFSMNACSNYEQFVEKLESVLKKLSGFMTPADIITMSVQGLYLHPVSSPQEFSQLVFAWSDSYMNDETTKVEVNDLGVDVAFEKDRLKINIICKLLQRGEVYQYFPKADSSHIRDINLFINIQVSTDEPLKLKNSITLSLSQAIKDHVHQATKIIEQRIDKG